MAELVKAEKFTEKEKFFELKMPDGRDLGHQPGQFVELSIFGFGEAPFGVCSSPTKQGSFELCVREVGSLTKTLHGLPTKTKVGIRGPFGKGFPVDELKGKDIIIVGGGMGLVPLRSLINYIIDRRKDFGKFSILYGTKSPGEIIFKDDIKEWQKKLDNEFLMTVDKGDKDWTGNVGVITTLFSKLKFNPATTHAVVVGPPIMFKFVIAELLIRGMTEDKIIVSLERRMKCGLGKCGHCQINNVYVCQCGPVFKYFEIKSLGEAL